MTHAPNQNIVPSRWNDESFRDPRLGQVFTPSPVADLALALALDGLGPRTALRLLDPACGEGIFLARAVAAGLDPRHVEGIDIDPRAAGRARTASAARVVRADFLDLPAPADLVDVVAGNPPYVRQELLGAADKGRILARLRSDWPDLGDRGGRTAKAPLGLGRADLALAFIARSLRFVRPGGRVAFVLSAAVFDAGYGDLLHAFLDGRARLVSLVSSPRERWFPDAAVHAVIAIFDRGTCGPLDEPSSSSLPPLSVGLPTAGPWPGQERRALEPGGQAAPAVRACPAIACAVQLQVPVAIAAKRVRGFADLPSVARVRAALSGGAVPSVSWGPLLRAPDAWFEAVRDAGDWLVPLGDLATVRRGVTSGANDFFYLGRDEAAASGIEPQFLVPLFKSPREAHGVHVAADRLGRLAFVCPDALGDLPPGALAHVRRHQLLATRPSLATRPRWWSLPAHPARLFVTKAYSARFVQHLADRPVVADQRFYAITPRAGVPLELLAAALNGALTALAIESLGRASMGEGALELAVSDAARLPILDVRRLAAGARARIMKTFHALAARPCGDVFTEADRPDRRALDDAFLESTPLSGRRESLTSALVATVEERLARNQLAAP